MTRTRITQTAPPGQACLDRIGLGRSSDVLPNTRDPPQFATANRGWQPADGVSSVSELCSGLAPQDDRLHSRERCALPSIWPSCPRHLPRLPSRTSCARTFRGSGSRRRPDSGLSIGCGATRLPRQSSRGKAPCVHASNGRLRGASERAEECGCDAELHRATARSEDTRAHRLARPPRLSSRARPGGRCGGRLGT